MADFDATVSRLRYIPVAAATVAIVFGVAVLERYFGYFLSLDPLLSPTRPLAALMFVLAGVALLALRLDLAPLRDGAAGLVAVIAAIVLAEYVFGGLLGFDALLFPATVRSLGGAFPGRPPPISAAVFVLGALLLLSQRAQDHPVLRGPRLVAAIGIMVLPIIPLAGHLMGASQLYSVGPGAEMALPATMVLLLLSLGVALTTHESEAAALLVDDDAGTVLLRRLLPLAVMLPLLFAVGSIHALRLGIYQVHVGLSIYVAAFIGLSLATAFWVAAVVRQSDAERRAADRANAELAMTDRLLQAEAAAGAAIRDSERRTRELLAILGHAPILARGLDGVIRFWSTGAERLYGWPAREAVGKRPDEFLRTEWTVPVRDAEAELLQHGEWQGELSRRALDGSRVQVNSHWLLHRDETGQPDAVIEVDRDVTAQKQAEEALQGSEARYRALVAAAAQIVWTASPDGKRAIDMKQWEAFTGQSAAAAGRGRWLEAVHPEDRAEAARAWNEALRERRMLATQHRLRRRDGEYRQMEVRAVPVKDENGRIREWIGAYTDITERVRAEEELGQARKLQAVGTLAGGVAHEVNNQLMAVLGFGDFVMGALGPDHPQAPDVQVMIRSATRASHVAQQLLTFSRRTVNQTRPMDLHAAVVALAPVLERLLGADKTLVILPNQSRHRVLADSTQIDQVLINLAANARDAMGTGGRLTIGVEELVLTESYARAHGVSHLLPGRYVRLTVSDTGCGMERATIAKMFEPFFTTKQVGAGTGLGLSTVYGIVKQHEGFIWAYSEPGAGTTMKVYLPVGATDSTAVAEKSPEPAAERRADLDHAVVLVVEDEPAVRNLVRRSLEAEGMVVIEARNGREALELVASHPERLRLVLTDVIMPELSGRELSETLARSQPGIPVLFMSGYTDDHVLTRSLVPETAPFIQKPFAPEDLVKRVRLLLSAGGSPRFARDNERSPSG